MLRKLLRWIFKIVVAIFACVGLFSLVGVAGLVFVTSKLLISDDKIDLTQKDEAVYINVHIEDDLVSYVERDRRFDRFFATEETLLFDRYMGLERLVIAADDPKIKGLRITLASPSMPKSLIDELMMIVKMFNKADKHSAIFLRETASNATSQFALAAYFDDFYVEKHSFYALTGYGLDIPFARDFLDQIGVSAQMAQRYEYKGGIDSYKQNKISEPLRQNLQNLIDNYHRQFEKHLIAGRNFEVKNLNQIVDKAPISDVQILKYHLADHVMNYDEWLNFIVKDSIDFDQYWPDAFYPSETEVRPIGVLTFSGVIGASDGHGLTSNKSSQKMIDHLKRLLKSDDYSAVLLIMNSPGGAFKMSWRIHSLIRQLSQEKIPVVTLLSDIAASGGYMISVASDRVVATPSTLTGSIGVYGGKISLQSMMEKIGVNWHHLRTGQNAGLNSPFFNYKYSQKLRLDAMLDQVYENFTTLVGERRNLSREALEQATRGRVFTGEQAAHLGLIDSVGGWYATKENIRQLTKMKEKTFLTFEHINQISKVENFIEKIDLLNVGYFKLIDKLKIFIDLALSQLFNIEGSHIHALDSRIKHDAEIGDTKIWAQMPPFILY
ncbi:MAG: signal peptide peptidase SppA [Pseudomonadota bacterium]